MMKENTVKRAFVSAVIALSLTLAGTGLAAAANPNGTGQPGAPTNTCGPSNLVTPGSSVNAQGSAFNPSGTAGTVYAGNPDTASLAHANSPLAVSQYDVACVQLSH
jgi:hypothetical protein